MFCSKCGTRIPDDAAFCHSCGNKIVRNLDNEPSVSQPEEDKSAVKEETHAPTVTVQSEPVDSRVTEMLLDSFRDKWDWFPAESIQWISNEFRKCDVNKANEVLTIDFANPTRMLSWSMVPFCFFIPIFIKNISSSGKTYYGDDFAVYFSFIVIGLLATIGACMYSKKKIGKFNLNWSTIKDDTKKSNLEKLEKVFNSKFRPI